MSPFVVPVTILAVLSIANADVSHLHGQNGQNGYQYKNLGLTSNLKLHTPENNPAPTQYIATYGDDKVAANLPNSYVPAPSGNPFGSVAPLPRTYLSPSSSLTPPVVPQSPPRLSAPQQSPLLVGQKYGQGQGQVQTQPSYQFPQSRSLNAAPSTLQLTQRQQGSVQTTQPLPQPLPQQPQAVFSNSFAQSQSQVQQTQQTQEPIITKHFYVHAAPDDPEEEAGPRIVQIGRPRKNYKIIFIKTPTYSEKQQIIPVLPPTEEKTIVYVLSKKPTFNQNVQIPEPAPTQPSKPDVFFIKYKTKEEAEQAQQQIQAAYDQANLSGSSDSIGQIAAQFASGSDFGNDQSTAFGGQDETQQNLNGGQYTSTTHKKRHIA